MAQLNAHVFVADRWYRPGEDVPADVAKLIRNPHVWEGDAPNQGGDDPDGVGHGDPNRPRGNASRDDWAAYAASRGIEFDENASRDELRAAVDAADAQNQE